MKGVFFLLLLFSTIANAQRFAVISDIHGASSDTYDVSVLVKSWNPEFIITAGDNHYGLSGTIDEQVGQFYSDFIFPYTGTFGSGSTVNKFFPCLGNHDIEGNGLINYLNYFELPGNERYYDFVVGNVHFFSVNSNDSDSDGVSDTSIQATWLRDQLAASISPYNVVYFHHPPYSSGMHGSSAYMRWPFRQWGASIVLSGHDHDYERFYVDSFPYIVCGVGGGTLYTVNSGLSGSIYFNCDNHGALLVNANTDSMNFEFRNTSDSLIDRLTIYNGQSTTNGNSGFIDSEVQLFQNNPNPAASATIIKFFLPRKGTVVLSISNISGEDISVISGEILNAGFHEVNWDTSNMAEGIYFISLKFENIVITRKAAVFDQ
ncbi:MAG: metallophosphoesterase [Bacteroidetes bacterium]|nr:metallophosphoesterase [Bacteroidota bacterium]